MTNFSLFQISKPGEHLVANATYTPRDLPEEFVYTEGDDGGRLDAFSTPIQLKILEFDEALVHKAFKENSAAYPSNISLEDFSYEVVRNGMDIDGEEFFLLQDNYGNTLQINDMKSCSKEVLGGFKAVTLTKLAEQIVEVNANALKVVGPYITNKSEVQALVSVFLKDEFLEKWSDDTVLFVY